MARIDTLKNFLTDIADKFRSVLGTTDAIPHSEYDTKIGEVYEAGKKVFGKLLVDGVTNFNRYFQGLAWNEKTFSAIETDIVPKASATYMFSGTLGVTDLDAALDGRLDTSQCLIMRYFINGTNIEVAPTISIESATDALYLINNNQNLHTIKKIIVPAAGGCPNMYYMIWQCPNVKEVRFEGIIDRSVNLQHCIALSIESLCDLMIHLKDFTGATNDSGVSSEFSYTLTLSSASVTLLDNNAVEVDGIGWREYMANKKLNIAEVEV